MEPYDPRQWTDNAQVYGAQRVFQRRGSGTAVAGTQDATGLEPAMPSPPPPYSSSRSGHQQLRPISMFESSVYSVPPSQNSSASSPPNPMTPGFPPPPASLRYHDRSSSSHRNLFNLANIRTSTLEADSLPAEDGRLSKLDDLRPPAAKRAASTGRLQTYQTVDAPLATQLGPIRKVPLASTWKPGMPLPGPPPGPPPSGSRTQSLNRYSESSSRSNSIGSDRSIDVSRNRRSAAAAASSSLGPVPPTPADWVDTDVPQAPLHQPLRIDTGVSHDPSTLIRRHAKRDSSGNGIRERRSRSRAEREAANVASPEAKVSKQEGLVMGTSDGSIRRRRDAHGTSREVKFGASVDSAVSPNTNSGPPTAIPSMNSVLTPPYTPAVGKASDDSLKRIALKAPGSASSDRQVSQASYLALTSGTPTLSSPPRPTSSSSAQPSAKLDTFFLQALERHRAFIESEAAASCDEDRLQLFASFIVNESRLRRDRYATAYNAMAGDIVDLTRDMWRSYAQQSKRTITPSTSHSSIDPTHPSWASDGQQGAAYGNDPSSASSLGEFTPGSELGGFIASDEALERAESHQRAETFKPSLSPIPSMNVSSTADEESSRGRTPSRWWDNSNSGSNSVGKPERIEKSHRETKYMGVNPAALQDHEETSSRNSRHTGSTPGPSGESFKLGPNEYPPEKVGWQQSDDIETPVPTPGHARRLSTPHDGSLDVSRLVTLPPPYPRHYPAVKNKHPLLADLRGEYRALADHTEISEIKDAYASQHATMQDQQDEAEQERRKQLRSNIQDRISDGTMSYAEAAQAEADFEQEEAERSKAVTKSAFDVFEASLAHPLNALLTARLEKANAGIDRLRVDLESRNEVRDPNQAQEEGDELPERLEKLTLLKWLFEAREQMHKEMYDLHADRSLKYSEVILTPFRKARQQKKIEQAEAFFVKDGGDRQLSFAKKSLQRFDDLQQIIETNVTRGVEEQLSAFWDIAPGLLEVIQHIPAEVSGVAIQIPEQEFAENPAYLHHPLQYLYTLLSHAQKSAYQFIESQTNLLCLLHEVRTARAKSQSRLVEIEERSRNVDDVLRKPEMRKGRLEREEVLTEDLKEKVGEVERQWNEALGEELEACKSKVKMFLEGSEGWEDGLDG
ncbi:hypothetical protein BDY17DRAFT_349977 [Neohortaea acidophila]|uniref:Uncharacterized protein n=1 Tax=Neohortaea acidophila TaxID=245834 RepID=A0A6A6PEW8_9PEZI|nr:uncharacterized protein BDY17DRAFT_349977 [Neohortaea acidophila]KAF2478475.1 hypothetical protein BDY17DRAFT_349977 [Neohortaea acidophila]